MCDSVGSENDGVADGMAAGNGGGDGGEKSAGKSIGGEKIWRRHQISWRKKQSLVVMK